MAETQRVRKEEQEQKASVSVRAGLCVIVAIAAAITAFYYGHSSVPGAAEQSPFSRQGSLSQVVFK